MKSKRNDDLTDVFIMLANILSGPEYKKVLSVMAQLFMGWKYNFQENDVREFLYEARNIYKKQKRLMSQNSEVMKEDVKSSFSKDLEVNERNEVITCKSKHNKKDYMKSKLILINGGGNE